MHRREGSIAKSLWQCGRFSNRERFAFGMRQGPPGTNIWSRRTLSMSFPMRGACSSHSGTWVEASSISSARSTALKSMSDSGKQPLNPAMRHIWAAFVMPHITAFALFLAAFELAVVVLLLSKGRAVAIGLTASLAFNLFLVQLGLGYPAVLGSARDFAVNRLANVLFILVQLPLYCFRFDRSLPGVVRARFRSEKSA